MTEIRYQKIHKMEPRDGVKYSTSYLKQTAEQRKQLCKHIRRVVGEIATAVEEDQDLLDFVRTPLKGFKTTSGQNRTTTDILTDMVNEAKGRKRDGMPKDFALAPIERWNKLFKATEYEIDLIQTFSSPGNNFHDLMEQLDEQND